MCLLSELEASVTPLALYGCKEAFLRFPGTSSDLTREAAEAAGVDVATCEGVIPPHALVGVVRAISYVWTADHDLLPSLRQIHPQANVSAHSRMPNTLTSQPTKGQLRRIPQAIRQNATSITTPSTRKKEKDPAPLRRK
jgi:hypothetical protein